MSMIVQQDLEQFPSTPCGLKSFGLKILKHTTHTVIHKNDFHIPAIGQSPAVWYRHLLL